MIDPPIEPLTVATEQSRVAAEPDLAAMARSDRAMAETATLEVLEEILDLSKRTVLTGTVRVSTTTESVDVVAEVALEHKVVDVTRVPIGRLVDVAPAIRTEGETTIVPVIEERFVVVKQLYLKEEVHLRHRVETEVSRVPVVLRRQTAVVDRIDAQGRTRPDVGTPSA